MGSQNELDEQREEIQEHNIFYPNYIQTNQTHLNTKAHIEFLKETKNQEIEKAKEKAFQETLYSWKEPKQEKEIELKLNEQSKLNAQQLKPNQIKLRNQLYEVVHEAPTALTYKLIIIKEVIDPLELERQKNKMPELHQNDGIVTQDDSAYVLVTTRLLGLYEVADIFGNVEKVRPEDIIEVYRRGKLLWKANESLLHPSLTPHGWEAVRRPNGA